MENAEEIGRIAESCKMAHKRLDGHDTKIDDLSKVYEALTGVNIKVDNVEKDVGEIKGDLKELKEKPAKNWEKLISTIITCIATITVGYFFGKFGL